MCDGTCWLSRNKTPSQPQISIETDINYWTNMFGEVFALLTEHIFQNPSKIMCLIC